MYEFWGQQILCNMSGLSDVNLNDTDYLIDLLKKCVITADATDYKKLPYVNINSLKLINRDTTCSLLATPWAVTDDCEARKDGANFYRLPQTESICSKDPHSLTKRNQRKIFLNEIMVLLLKELLTRPESISVRLTTKNFLM